MISRAGSKGGNSVKEWMEGGGRVVSGKEEDNSRMESRSATSCTLGGVDMGSLFE